MVEAIFGWIIKKAGENAFGKVISDTLEEKFPNLFKNKTKELEKKFDLSHSRVINHLESVDEIKKEYKNKLEKNYQCRIDEAKVKLDAGKNETAKKEYEIILRDLNLETEEIDLHLFFRTYNNLGVSELNIGNLERAAKFFEKAYSFDPEEPIAIANYALSKLLKDRPKDGLTIIDKLLKKYPNHNHGVSVKANILHTLKQYDELMSFLKEKGKLGLISWYGGFEAMDKKDYDTAISSFEKLINLEPKNIRVYLLAAQNVMVGTEEYIKENAFPSDKIPPLTKEKFIKAISWLKKAIELLQDREQKIDLETAYTNLSGCSVAIGLYDEAISSAEKAIAINSVSSIPFLNKGIAQLKIGKYKESISSFIKYKELGSGDLNVDRHIAFCFLKISALEDAEKVIAPLLENSKDLDIIELGVELYSRRVDDFAKLESLLKKLEESYPDNPQALRIRATHLQRLGITGAESLFQKALENSESDSDIFFSEIDLGNYFYSIKNFFRAAEIYQKYLNIEESNSITLKYAECLYNSGQYGNLLKWIEALSDSVRKKDFIQEIEAYSSLYLGNLERASILFKELFEKNSNEFKYLVFYGMCQFRLGKENEAKKVYDAVKNRVSETADIAMLVGGYEFIGEWKVALELAYKALENEPNNPKAHLSYIYTFLRKEQVEDEEFEDKYVKAFQKSICGFNKRFPEEKALQRFEIKDKYINLFKIVDKLVESTENITGLYRESKVPLAVISKFINRKPFDVWATFTQMRDVGIKISYGLPDETLTEVTTIKEYHDNSIVVDIYPLFLLSHLNKLELLKKLFKKVYVHQSIVDELTEAINYHRISIHKGQKIFGKIDNQYKLIEIPPEQIQKTVALLERIRDFLSKNESCKICGLSKERDINERNLINALHNTSRDSVFLADDLNLPLYCDDRMLRVILRNEYNIKSFSTQPLINLSQAEGIISLNERFELQKEMIDFSYEFVSMDAAFIYFFLKKENYNMNNIQNIITMLASRETSIQSLGVVLTDLSFILFTDQLVDSKKKLEIFKGILSQVRINHDLRGIEEGISINLQKRLEPEKREQLREMIRSFFGDL